ncbi:MAG TPA: hypothetical protein VNO55_13860 [Polyangia bacterium]|nr:hypothetical protein [Polyangia bacterium]
MSGRGGMGLAALLVLAGCEGHLDFDPNATGSGVQKSPSNAVAGGTGGAWGATDRPATGSGGAWAAGMDATAPPGATGWDAGIADTNPTVEQDAGSGAYGDATAMEGGPAVAMAVTCPAGFNVLTAVFASKCGGCHGGSAPTKNLDLVSAGLGARLVNKTSTCKSEPLLAKTLTGNKATGLLFQKLAGDVTGCGVRMPAGAPALSDVEMACVSDWAVAAVNKANGVTSP